MKTAIKMIGDHEQISKDATLLKAKVMLDKAIVDQVTGKSIDSTCHNIAAILANLEFADKEKCKLSITTALGAYAVYREPCDILPRTYIDLEFVDTDLQHILSSTVKKNKYLKGMLYTQKATYPVSVTAIGGGICQIRIDSKLI